MKIIDEQAVFILYQIYIQALTSRNDKISDNIQKINDLQLQADALYFVKKAERFFLDNVYKEFN